MIIDKKNNKKTKTRAKQNKKQDNKKPINIEKRFISFLYFLHYC